MPRGFACAALLFFGAAAVAAAGPAPLRVATASGLRIELDPDGGYAVTGGTAGWTFAGRLGAAPEGAAAAPGADAAGAYQEVRFKVRFGAGPFAGSIRAYEGSPVARFALMAGAAGPAGPAWPDFTVLPPGLHRFSYREEAFAPPAFAAEDNGTPWLFFDDRGCAAILSPAANFLTAAMTGDGVRSAGCGLNPGAASVPAGFTRRALLVFAPGINAAWAAWGRAMPRGEDGAGRESGTGWEGEAAPAGADAAGLRYLGYGTGSGSYYNYNYDPALGYAGTLERLLAHCRAAGVPVGYLQLGGWWYAKGSSGPDGRPVGPANPRLPAGAWNREGGCLRYAADPAVLPEGLEGLERKIFVPLLTEGRWMDPASPDRTRYRISGYAVVAPRWWEQVMGDLARAGVQGYEQDWLDAIYRHSPELRTVPGEGEKFTDGMAAAAAARGMGVQYGRALPRFILQGAAYANLTAVRAGGDRLGPADWDAFLYTARLAGALGLRPNAGVLRSTEPDNLLLATLSGGPVTFGDAPGAESRDGLLRAARPDGVLIKPDAPLYPSDETFLADARGEKAPMVAWTWSGNPRTVYVFAYGRSDGETTARFAPAQAGLRGRLRVWDARRDIAWQLSADTPVTLRLKGRETRYLEMTAVEPSGLACFGDEGKFVSNGTGRIAAYRTDGYGAKFAVLFAKGEAAVRLFGFAPRAPRVTVTEGSAGRMLWDPDSGKFEFYVLPGETVYWGAPSGNLQPDQTQVAQVEIAVPAAGPAVSAPGPGGAPRP